MYARNGDIAEMNCQKSVFRALMLSLVIGAPFASPAWADSFSSTPELLERCRQTKVPAAKLSSSDTLSIGICFGYLRGIADTMKFHCGMSKAENMRKEFRVVFQETGIEAGSLTNGKAVDILIGYIERNPERLESLPYLVVMDAFREASPCLPIN